MSQPESVRNNSAHTNGPQVHSVSLGKLRQISGAAGGAALGLAESDSTALLDAFSEIFARMAASEAAPAVIEPGADSEVVVDDESIRTSDHDASEKKDQAKSETGSSDQDVSHLESAADFAIESEFVGNEQVAVDTDIDHVNEANNDQTIELDSPISSNGHETEDVELIDVKPVDIVRETVATGTEWVVDNSDHRDGRSKQREEPVVTFQADEGDADSVDTTKQATKIIDAGAESDTEVSVADATGDDEQADDPRRRSRRGRRGRNDNGFVERAAQDAPVSTQNRRSGGMTIPTEISGAGDKAPNAVPPAAEKVLADSAKVTQSTNVAIQAASRAAAAAATTARAPTSTSQPGLTGNVQPTTKPAAPVADTAKRPQTQAKKVDTSEAVNRAKLIQRVSKAFQHLGPDGGHVRLRLAPAELGTVRLEMRMNHRRVNARVIAESEAAGNALREHLPELRQRLESQGIQVERFEISVDSSDQDSRSALGHGQSQSHHEGHRNQDASWRRDRGSVSQTVSQNGSEVSDHGGPIVTIPLGGGIDVRL